MVVKFPDKIGDQVGQNRSQQQEEQNICRHAQCICHTQLFGYGEIIDEYKDNDAQNIIDHCRSDDDLRNIGLFFMDVF